MLYSRNLSQEAKNDHVLCRTVSFFLSDIIVQIFFFSSHFLPLISSLVSGKKQGKERLCHGDPGWLLPLFSHLKPLPLLNYLWTCVRFLILCFYFWAIRDWVLKKDFQKHFHFQHGLNFVLRAKITPRTTSLNGQGIWNFIFLLEFSSGISFWIIPQWSHRN